MSQPKVVRIEFDINAGIGELKFRTFRSDRPISGKMFVIPSKLTPNNQVSYQFIGADGNGPVILSQGVVSIEEFFTRVKMIEAQLRVAASLVGQEVNLIEDNDDRMMLTNHEGFKDAKISKEEAAKLLQHLQSQKSEPDEEDIASILKSAPSSNRLKKYF